LDVKSVIIKKITQIFGAEHLARPVAGAPHQAVTGPWTFYEGVNLRSERRALCQSVAERIVSAGHCASLLRSASPAPGSGYFSDGNYHKCRAEDVSRKGGDSSFRLGRRLSRGTAQAASTRRLCSAAAGDRSRDGLTGSAARGRALPRARAGAGRACPPLRNTPGTARRWSMTRGPDSAILLQSVTVAWMP